jgi:hypothetical protein
MARVRYETDGMCKQIFPLTTINLSANGLRRLQAGPMLDPSPSLYERLGGYDPSIVDDLRRGCSAIRLSPSTGKGSA